tara:strand:+ start:658 stop:2433 length:1776 start_codon:yes stop_codon:yes gene_type:complete
MQIPIYKTQVRATSEAPGARITARMNAQPFVQAALQTGSIATEVANQVGEYANMRYKMIVETQKNEAIFSAKEALMGLSSTLEKSTDVANIFDGENKYDEGVNGVFNELRSRVGKNKYALQDFDSSFRQMEIPIKFRLREVVDLKIEKRRQAALLALENQQVSTLSDPYLDMTRDELAMSQAGLQIAHNQAVANGGVNPEIMGNVSQKVLSKALKNLIPAYAGNDLNLAFGLSSLLDQIDRVNSGDLKPQDMVGIESFPSHVVNMLQAVPAEEAKGIVQDTIKMAATFFNAKEKLEGEREEEIGKANVKAYNFVISLDKDEKVTLGTLKDLLDYNDMKKVYEIYGADLSTEVLGSVAQTILFDGLTRQMWASPEQQAKMEKVLSSETDLVFRTPGNGDGVTYSMLNGMATQGTLTVDELNSNKAKLSLDQHTGLRNKIATSGNAFMTRATNIIKRRFNYDAQQAANNDSGLAAASKAAFEAADGALQEEFFIRRADGNPMTSKEILSYAQEQITEYEGIYLEQLKENFSEDLTSKLRALDGIDFNAEFQADPLAVLDRWYDGLTATQQGDLESKYFSAKANIRKYANKGLF